MSKVFILTVLLVTACIDPIDFEVPAGVGDSIVVQGRVVLGESSFVEIAISRLFDFSPESRQPVSVREVMLFDDNNNEMLLETRTPGFYKETLDSTTPIQAVVGRGYKIRIETFDNRTFESTMDIMPANFTPDELNLSITQINGVDGLGNQILVDRLNLSIDTQVDNTTDGGIYWEVNAIYRVTDSGINDPDGIVKTCYFNKTADVNEIFVLDPGALVGGRVTDFDIGLLRIDSRFAEGFYYEVLQYSLSRDAFRYWNGIDILSEREGNMFDGPVGEIPSNLSNIDNDQDFIFGYFFATQEEVIRKRVDPALVAGVPPFCPSASMCFAGPGSNCICAPCCDCLEDPDATLIRPDFWID